MRLENRNEAGLLLAEKLQGYGQINSGAVVLALPRGGVPVGYEVATSLKIPLDVFIVRKLGVPENEELALGAVASGGCRVINQSMVEIYSVSEDALAALVEKEEQEIKRREATYRANKLPLNVEGKTVILVDDGMATGSTVLAAILSLKRLRPQRIIVALPVAPPDACAHLAGVADALVCLFTPEPFFGVGQWYKDFAQTTDAEVIELLEKADEELRGRSNGNQYTGEQVHA